jgi:hypothetical protein
MNGSSFYSAKGAQEANLGKYQGTNVAGNYYVKTKEVINSCLGTTPGKPILNVIDVDINSITFSWEDTGSTLCKVSYYNLTYYSIQILGTVRELTYDNNYDNYDNYDNKYDNNYNNNKQFITSSKDVPYTNTVPIFDDAIYTDLDNNIKYKIISQINTNTVMPVITDTFTLTYTLKGLTKNTAYVAYINGINGNGAGESSDKVITETLLNPNVVVNIQSQPPYSFEYNNIPQILYGYATSDIQMKNPNNIIRTSITYDTNAIYTNVALMYGNNTSKNIFKISLQNAGYFNVYAYQTKFGQYGASSFLSLPVVITKSTPTINFKNISNTQPIYYGRTYQLSDAKIGNVNNNKNDGKTILFDYQTNDSNIASIQTDINTNIKSLYITGIGMFNIVINAILNSQLSQNYNTPAPYISSSFTVQKSTPSILQSPKFIASGTYGSPYTFYPPSINYTPTKQPPGSISQTLLYSIKNSSPAGIASIDAAGNVTINGAGTFNIYSYCNSTSFYNDNSLLSPTITIDKQKPTIAFSKTFLTGAKYDVSYNLVSTTSLVPATINNNVQTLSYNVVNSVPANNVVNISTIYDNTNTGTNSGNVQYSPPSPSPSQSNNLQKISYGIRTPTSEGFLNSISFQQLNANIPTSYYIVSVQSVSHNVSINSTYSTYSNPYAMSSTVASPNPTYPAFPKFSTAILSTIVDDVYINNISIALAYPLNSAVTNYSFACDLFVKDTVTKKPVNLTNNQLNVIQLPGSTPGGSLYMYNISCNVILTETQLATATLVIKSGSNASYYPSTTTGNMYITVNYISILTSKCSLVSIPANVTTSQNFDLTDFSVLMNPAHSYTISLWLLGNITQNISGYDIYSGNGTVCATNGSTPYIYGTILQGIPITTISDITKPFYFNGLGTFYILASCNSTLNYDANNKLSKNVVIAKEVPSITFSTFLNTTGVYNISFVLPMPLATVNNNIQNISYSIVTPDDDEIISTVASINSGGTELLINSVGTFIIKASVIETANLDFSHKDAFSNIITINKGTPSIIFDASFNTMATYLKNSTFQIFGVSTTNTDTPGPILSYSSSDTTVADISGNTVTIISAGFFYIYVSCTSTNNFNGVSGTTSVNKSPKITINKATPSFIYSSDFYSNWTFTSLVPYSLIGSKGITTTNTDSDSSILFNIPLKSQQNMNIQPAITIATNIATISGTNITIKNAGYFTLYAVSPETKNFKQWAASPIYITIQQITPVISFPIKPDKSWTYGEGPITFTAASIKNYDPSQTITYSITNVNTPPPPAPPPPNPAFGPPVVYTLDPTKISIQINSVGTFQLNASCLGTINGNYKPASKFILFSVGVETPTITFSGKLPSTITYTKNYLLPQPIATVNNNVQTQSLFSYKAVNVGDDNPSDIASISSDNTYLTIYSVGNFRIYATVENSPNHDFSSNDASYNIVITPATPTITNFPTITPLPSSNPLIPLPQIPPPFIYDNTYQIPPYTSTPPYTITTSNLDRKPGPVITYESSDITIATISGSVDYSSVSTSPISSINGTRINIIGVGKFQIYVTIGDTANYKAMKYTYPSGLVYTSGTNYTSYDAKAAPTVVEFLTNESATYDVSYNFIPATIKVPNPSNQTITYSIK